MDGAKCAPVRELRRSRKALSMTHIDVSVCERRRGAFHYIHRTSHDFGRVRVHGVSARGYKIIRDTAELEFASRTKDLRRKHLRHVARPLHYSACTACAGSNRVMLQPHALTSRKGQTHPKGGGAKLPV